MTVKPGTDNSLGSIKGFSVTGTKVELSVDVTQGGEILIDLINWYKIIILFYR